MGATATYALIIDAMSFVPEEQYRIEDILARLELSDYSSEPIGGGANNRVWHLSSGAQSLILKQYFCNRGDTRDRYQSEYLFYQYLQRSGINYTAESIDWFPSLRVALFKKIEGRKLERHEISKEHVSACVRFISELNPKSLDMRNVELLEGAEACYTVQSHLDTVQRRLDRLLSIQGETSIERDCREFVINSLVPKWNDYLEFVIQRGGGNQCDETVSKDIRLISPSDFGFHNALLRENNELIFFDFEYAGWDSPHKLICDFFCQPEIPCPAQYFDEFSQLIADVCEASRVVDESKLLFSAYRIKWCCIMLNEFLPLGNRRRAFSLSDEQLEDRQSSQLEKARKALECFRLSDFC